MEIQLLFPPQIVHCILPLLEVACTQGSVRQLKFQLSSPTSQKKAPTTILDGYSTQQQCHGKGHWQSSTISFSLVLLPVQGNVTTGALVPKLAGLCVALHGFAQNNQLQVLQAVSTSTAPATSALTRAPEPDLRNLLGRYQNHPSRRENALSF